MCGKFSTNMDSGRALVSDKDLSQSRWHVVVVGFKLQLLITILVLKNIISNLFLWKRVTHSRFYQLLWEFWFCHWNHESEAVLGKKSHRCRYFTIYYFNIYYSILLYRSQKVQLGVSQYRLTNFHWWLRLFLMTGTVCSNLGLNPNFFFFPHHLWVILRTAPYL